jgi:microsomal dipeptidase-like Zn-dependent dipeptidase
MGRKGATGVAALALACLLAAPAIAPAASTKNRYTLAKGCFSLRSVPVGKLVAKPQGGGYAAAAGRARAERFRLQPTDLGIYLLYDRKRNFLAASGSATETANEPSPAAEWRIAPAGKGIFRLRSFESGKLLKARPGSGALALGGGRNRASKFRFVAAKKCKRYPEVSISAKGRSPRGRSPMGETRGMVDAHMHMMAFEFLGGDAHCGRPWHRYGAPYALVDCPDHTASDGCGAVLENVLFGDPARCHDPVGWPTFKDWPHHNSLTHEQSYYRWLERTWRGGLRIFVNLFVENHALCTLYPIKHNSCNEMDSVRLQARDIYDMQDYIDAQAGGPGKGFFRIVRNPFQARRVINRGKLAVVLGIEVSQPFDCTVFNEQPGCTQAMIKRQLNEMHALGVRDMELINKFDNALAGVAGDANETGVVINSANFFETGKFWQMETCRGKAHDKPQLTPHNEDNLVANGFAEFGPPGVVPLYPPHPHCNKRTLTDLGRYAVRRLIARRMIIDPDHLSAYARAQVLTMLERRRYSGIVSSHSWADEVSYPRIYKLGGIVTPYAGDSEGFVKQWKFLRPLRNRKVYFGFGWGADMNGFGAQGGPRNGPRPVRYPFKSFDGNVTFQRQRSGKRRFDINTDGVAHYGLYPDWVQDLRRIAGRRIIRDLARGSEAYLQMWERALGIRSQRCLPAGTRRTAGGFGPVRVGLGPKALLMRAGQPQRRVGRTYSYCVQGGNRVVATFDETDRVAQITAD